MICDKCKKNKAEYRVYETIGGKTFFLNLCTECNRIYEIGDLKILNKRMEHKYSVCPICSTSIREFMATRLFGCSYCYEFFHDVAQKYFGQKCYVGQAPQGYHKFRNHEKLNKLKEELDLAIIQKDTKQIAILSSQIEKFLKG